MSQSAEKRKELRKIALLGISGGKLQCNCCQEKRIWTLCFDHIHNGGTKHRRENSNNPTVKLVWKEYRTTGKWNTDRYQILCANCNHGKRVGNGICPHNSERRLKLSRSQKNILKSYVKVFLATVLSLFVSDGADIFSVTFSDFRTWLSAGIASLVPLLITALDPTDDRFGKVEE